MIDLWDIGTYDSEIKDYLESHRDIIDGYSALERKKDIMVAKLATWVPIQPNRFQGDYAATVDGLAEIMSTKTLRTFHYTRMTDDEVESVQAEGMVPTSVDSLNNRVDRQVAAGGLTPEQGTRIIKRPRLRTDFGVRKGFWSTTVPLHPDESAVKLLVEHWGGESAYWLLVGTEDEDVISVLKEIGRGRVFEITVPLAEANGGLAGFSVARIAVREYACSLGSEFLREGLDLGVEHKLPPSNILRIHSEGEEGYTVIGRGYPTTYKEPE
ncbi:hypothetical protein BPNPMPFG_007606 (plasmid) [Mesorhizobium sp. AR07]|uniref:hypothetical protein n=1 Tax=Mesorhizobium sp. AR07 TaxID=2865838 RepID=UPI00215F1B87|nr:hypothetical protein [Mesorhizobium sp. AR07]UVK48267.1 hypothetical protein BPNPMPFG_007606 [Mesorhizobium sp. AR07]